jgi:hypothetical protein
MQQPNKDSINYYYYYITIMGLQIMLSSFEVKDSKVIREGILGEMWNYLEADNSTRHLQNS